MAHRVSSRFEVISGAEVAAAMLLELGRIDDAAALHSFSHARATEWNQQRMLAQFSLYHEELVAVMDSLPAEQLDRAHRRGLTTPVPILIEQIRFESHPSH